MNDEDSVEWEVVADARTVYKGRDEASARMAYEVHVEEAKATFGTGVTLLRGGDCVECWGPEKTEPAEDDLTSNDHVHWYQYGKLVLTTADPDDPHTPADDMVERINAFMEKSQFWPEAWWCSDHGNWNRVVLTPEGEPGAEEGQMVKQCPGCGHAVPMRDHGDDCYLGECPECLGELESVLADKQTGARGETFTPGPGEFEVAFEWVEEVTSRGSVVVKARTRAEARALADAAKVGNWVVTSCGETISVVPPGREE